MARGKDILDASEKGLVKAAEHFLRLDPKCMEAKDADGRETLARSCSLSASRCYSSLSLAFCI